MSREMTGAEMVVQALIDQGVTTLFGYPGGAVLPIYDALFQQDSVKHVLVRHEQGAVHAAEGYARSSGKVGVVLVTSGPGRDQRGHRPHRRADGFDPIVCFTGQVPTHLIGSDAFQEADTVGITRHCTKHNYLVKSIEDLPRILHEASMWRRTAVRARWSSTSPRTSSSRRASTRSRATTSTRPTGRRSRATSPRSRRRWR